MWRPERARSIASAVVVLLAVSGTAATAASSDVHAKKAKKADLVVKDVAGSVTGRSVTVSAKVTNKPGKKQGKKSKASAVGVVLSADPAVGAGDTTLGQVALAKLKPKKSATVTGVFSVPAAVPAGSYYLVACADPAGVVKEKKEQNNCSASAATVTVAAATPAPPATITVTYSVSPPLSGVVSATASNGTCVANPATGGGVCTVTAGVGTVVLTPGNLPFVFGGVYQAGASGPCDGVKVANNMTFTAPTVNKSCIATYF